MVRSGETPTPGWNPWLSVPVICECEHHHPSRAEQRDRSKPVDDSAEPLCPGLTDCREGRRLCDGRYSLLHLHPRRIQQRHGCLPCRCSSSRCNDKRLPPTAWRFVDTLVYLRSLVAFHAKDVNTCTSHITLILSFYNMPCLKDMMKSTITQTLIAYEAIPQGNRYLDTIDTDYGELYF